ncbi:MAG: prepilin-type N-terminal cleavage/methylation domain-containing protein [Verrucomicrobia bacterium]|nr:prepilin-type N-terminal cleavage/methylation domain-containing protein [Verrucomicrobiota bacterium]
MTPPTPTLRPGRRPAGGFTLVEVLIGMTLALVMIGAVLSTFTFLGRSFTRTLGIGSANQPNLEMQGRRVLGYFANDIRTASAVYWSSTSPTYYPSSTEFTLVVPDPTGGTRKVTYYYNSTAAVVAYLSCSIPAKSLVRIDQATSVMTVLHSNLLTCSFSYYDSATSPYTTFTSSSYLNGIKQVALLLTAQVGSSTNQTLSEVSTVASPRLAIGNKGLSQ